MRRRRRKNSWNLSPEFRERFKKEKFIRAHRIRISGIGRRVENRIQKFLSRRWRGEGRRSLSARLFTTGCIWGSARTATFQLAEHVWNHGGTAKLGHGYCLNSYVTDESFCREMYVLTFAMWNLYLADIYIYIYIYMDEIARIMNRARWMVQAVVCGFHVGRDAFDLFC